MTLFTWKFWLLNLTIPPLIRNSFFALYIFCNQEKRTIINLEMSCNKKNNFMAHFYGWGSTASRLEPLRGGSLLFTTNFPEIPGTHFIDLGRMTG